MFSGALGSKAECLYKAVGDTFVIPLDDVEEEIPPDTHLFWTHNETRVYIKRDSTVKVKTYNINTRGSLILENIQIIQSGKYTAQVYNKDGKLLKESVKQLCVRGACVFSVLSLSLVCSIKTRPTVSLCI